LRCGLDAGHRDRVQCIGHGGPNSELLVLPGDSCPSRHGEDMLPVGRRRKDVLLDPFPIRENVLPVAARAGKLLKNARLNAL